MKREQAAEVVERVFDMLEASEAALMERAFIAFAVLQAHIDDMNAAEKRAFARAVISAMKSIDPLRN